MALLPLQEVKERVSIALAKGMNTLSGNSNTLQEKDKDKEKDKEEEQDRKKKATCDEIMEFCKSNGLFPRDAEYLWNKWEANGWQNANKPIKDWKAVIRSWKAQGYLPTQKQQLASDCWPEPQSEPEPEIDLMALMMANKAKAEAREREAEGTPPEDVPFDESEVF